MQATAELHLRSYDELGVPDRHAFAQLVLPVHGSVELDIAGKQDRLGLATAAFVPPGVWHEQRGEAGNSSIIVDLDLALLTPDHSERLHDQVFSAINPASRKLIEFMALMMAQQAPAAPLVQGWLPMLLDTLALGTPRPVSRLAALMARIEAEPAGSWHTEAMARSVGVSVSRLHALFRSEHDTTPHDWLMERRLALACAWLAQTDLPIAELALRAGFSEQSALNRAMRAALDTTPAAYRRQRRSPGGLGAKAQGREKLSK